MTIANEEIAAMYRPVAALNSEKF